MPFPFFLPEEQNAKPEGLGHVWDSMIANTTNNHETFKLCACVLLGYWKSYYFLKQCGTNLDVQEILRLRKSTETTFKMCRKKALGEKEVGGERGREEGKGWRREEGEGRRREKEK